MLWNKIMKLILKKLFENTFQQGYFLKRISAFSSLLFFVLLTQFGCTTAKSDPESPPVTLPPLAKPKLELIASEKMQMYFPILEKTYLEEEVFSALDSIRDISNETCEMIYSMRPYDKERIKAYTNIELGSPLTSKFYLHTFRRIIAGCWNFFQMNDISPNKDFEYVKNLYPNAKFDCYSVGFLQPYIMHSKLGCENLYLLDIDLRIIEGHAQLLKFFHENKMQNEEEVLNNIKQLNVGWIAQYKIFNAKTNVTLNSLCPKNYEMCLQELLNFQKKYTQLKKVSLYASALHEANLLPENSKISVVYLSNAFEDYYTKKKEFDFMMKRLEEELKENQKIVFIYHNGGRHLFGVYEVTKVNNELEISSSCRDRYLFYPEEEERTYYNIHFDRLKNLKASGKYCSPNQVQSQLAKKENESEKQ